MIGWLLLGLAGILIVLLTAVISRFRGRGHLGADRSTGYHISENEAWYHRPH